MSNRARKARRAAEAQAAAEEAAAAQAPQVDVIELAVVEETVVETVEIVEATTGEAPAEEAVAEDSPVEEGEALSAEAVTAEGQGDATVEPAIEADLPPEELRAQALRVVEAMIFASSEALSIKEIAKRLPKGVDVAGIVDEIEATYAARGVNLVRVAGKLAFRTAADVADRLKIERVVARKLSKAATETLAIVAYQTAEGRPVTRAEIEEIRGVALSKGTLEILMEAEFVQPKGHRETPGRPVTYAITDKFLEHFGLDSIKALPGLKELRELGLLDTRPAVSAYSEDGGLAAAPAMGETSDEEEGPIDEREMPSEEPRSAEIVELHSGSDAETEAVEAESDDDDADDDDDDDDFEDDDEDDEDFDDEEAGDETPSEGEPVDAVDDGTGDEIPERKPE